MVNVTLKEGRHPRIFHGHPWIYSNEIAAVSGTADDKGLVSVSDSTGKFIGTGYMNEQSQIAVRLLTREKGAEIDADFFRRRIRSCLAYRKVLGFGANCRLVFSEGDFLPGLIVDRFGDVLILQTLAKGIDCWKKVLASILTEETGLNKVYERNDAPVRKLEGLSEIKGFLSDPFETIIETVEDGLRFRMDVAQGQKTGFFLDQKENRMQLKSIAHGAEVLDCFCYTGSFSMYAARFGASKILGLDASADAITQATIHAQLNGFENTCNFRTANAFDELPQLVQAGRNFDIVILDPPAFTKSRSGMESARRGYKEINLRGMKLVRSGGFLLTFSCSHFMEPGQFFDLVSEAARDAGKTVRQVAFLQQSRDHPVVWNIPETSYLKGFLLQLM